MSEDTKISSETYNLFNEDFIEKKKKNHIIPVLILILLLFGLIIGCIYYYNSRPYNIITKLINMTYEQKDKFLNNNYNYNLNEDTLKYTGNITFDTNMTNELKNEIISYTLGLDEKNKKEIMSFSFNEGNEKILETIYYILGEKVYQKTGDRVIELDGSYEELELSSVIESNDINYILNEFREILIKIIDIDNIKTSRKKISINSKELNVQKTSYNLSSKNLKKMANDMITEINKNGNLLEKLGKLLDLEIDKIKSKLDSFKNYNFDNYGEINIYTKGLMHDIVKVEYVEGDFETSLELVTTPKVYIKSEYTELIFTFNKYDKNELDVDLNINLAGFNISTKITSKVKEENNKKRLENITFRIDYFTYYFAININNTFEIGAEIENLDTTGSIKESELTEEDRNKMEVEIMNKLMNSNLMKLIENLIPNNKNLEGENYQQGGQI